MSPSDAPYSPPPRGPHERQRSDIQGDNAQPSERQPAAVPGAKAGDDAAAERIPDGTWPGGEIYGDKRRYKHSDVNYKERYDPDPYGEELGPQARVWSVYNDEAWRADKEQRKRLNGTLDVLLVFAGIFSAVITTFVAQSSLKLEPDYAKITASLVYELVLVQRASRLGTPVSDVPLSGLSFDTDTYRTTDLWVNGLWLTSLVLSMVTALASVLAKQWIQYLTSPTGNTPREHAHIRQYRLQNFERWNVPFIIGFLPVLLTIALFLFLAGLAVYTTPGDPTISYVIVGFSVAITLIYGVSIILPIFVPDCAYKTAISNYVMIIPHWIYRTVRRKGVLDNSRHLRKSFFEEREKDDAQRQHIALTEGALDWLYTSSSNASAATIALQAGFAHLTRRDRQDLDIQSAFMRFIGVMLLPSWMQLLQDVVRYEMHESSLRLTLSRGHDRLAWLWGRPTQMALWHTYKNDLGNLESGLREVTQVIMHIRDLSQMETKPRYLLYDIQAKVEVLIPMLPTLFLHPVVWRDLEVAVLYCLSLDDGKDTGLQSGRTKSLELPLKATGDPWEHTPMSLAKYDKARRGKKGGDKQGKKGAEKLLQDMHKLQRILLQVIRHAKDMGRPNPRGVLSLTRTDTMFVASRDAVLDTVQLIVGGVRRLVNADRADPSTDTAIRRQEDSAPDDAPSVVGASDVHTNSPPANISIGTNGGGMSGADGSSGALAAARNVDHLDDARTDPASEGRVGDAVGHTSDVTLDSYAADSDPGRRPGPSTPLSELPRPEAADEAPALPAAYARHTVRLDTSRSPPSTDSC